jgi:hypothetical protein
MARLSEALLDTWSVSSLFARNNGVEPVMDVVETQRSCQTAHSDHRFVTLVVNVSVNTCT